MGCRYCMSNEDKYVNKQKKTDRQTDIEVQIYEIKSKQNVLQCFQTGTGTETEKQ